MSLWRIAWRYVWSRPLVTLLTLFAVALGAALVSGVLTLRKETERAFLEEGTTIDLVVGAKGSPLQLVLSSIYHLDVPTGNIPWTQYEEIAADDRVRTAVPIGLGDNYRGWRIVGTTPAFYDMERRNRETQDYERLYEIAEGEWNVGEPFTAILGAEVAEESGLAIGDTFSGSHGIVAIAGSEEHDEFPYTVVGILEPSGTATDRTVLTSIESVWRVHAAEDEMHRQLFAPRTPTQPEPEPAAEPEDYDDAEAEDYGDIDAEDAGEPAEAGAGSSGGGGWLFAPRERESVREATAVLIQLRAVGQRLWMAEEINEDTNAMAAIPINEMLRLYQQILAPVQRSLLAVAWLVVIVAALSVLTTLYQAGERRRRDIALMRSLGATAPEIFVLVLLEAFFVSVLGVFAGWLLGHGAVAAGAEVLRSGYGVAVQPFATTPAELLALGTIAGIGLVAGVVPAILAYRRSPAEDIAGA